jgi:hypothetical protein
LRLWTFPRRRFSEQRQVMNKEIREILTRFKEEVSRIYGDPLKGVSL